VEDIQQYWTLQWKICSSTGHFSGRYTAVLDTAVEDIQQYWTLQWKIYKNIEQIRIKI
jgi:uncharacterized protein YjaG (DUF416 family)